ncbi:transcriptional regulator, AraC family with amidase-like domain [Methylophilus rhizosphaerae]|uniref:Transcriptional regulator, AraC family with amidase-like domain n=1 Tax=Methylophilus rhizosphaerae TaxID=492660 RepID=A0A1G9BR16_9PROT|nr:GlxA family transcriptional regulator [Methylophilus rhizosphaerae]SDK41922.1 transcriptional regulator, AraC family with amidase-like domain [Methylophilus rhizosphaerae]
MADMTYIPKYLPTSRKYQKLVVFVAFPQMGLLDMTGAQTVFWAASRYLEERGLPPYDRHTISLDGGLVNTAEGVALDTRVLSDFDNADIDTIIVPGSPYIIDVLGSSSALALWLSRQHAKVRRMASVCSGAFLLAQAGLLEGKRAATHWAMLDLLRERYPSIEIDGDAIFVHQDSIWTSAGVTAGIDLALALVEEDCGREIAMKVARELVVYMKRSGGQSQFSELLQSQSADISFDQLNEWICSHLQQREMTIDTLAAKACMSPRNFARVYKQKTGRTPAKAIEIFRLEAARRLLEDSPHSIQEIAARCGFGDEERMRITFHRHLAVSPSEYRKRFSTH